MVSSNGHDAKQVDILPGSGRQSEHFGFGGADKYLNLELAPPSDRNTGVKDDTPGARVCCICICNCLIDPVFARGPIDKILEK